MDINLELVLNNISSPVLVARPIRDEFAHIIDFSINYTNEAMKKAVGFVIKNSTKWSEFSENITSDVPWFSLALDAMEGNTYDTAKYYSPSTKSWYKIDMAYDKELEAIILTFINITSEQDYYFQLQRSLSTDVLTGFPNRTTFNETFRVSIENSSFNNQFAALLLLDIDNLKNINDSQGITFGDNMILETARILKKFVSSKVEVFRYGDDEFAVIMHNFDSEAEIVNFTDCVFEAFQMQMLKISGGISISGIHSLQSEELIRFADMAIHYAKKMGKNNFTFFEPEMHRIFIQHLTIQSKMTNAILESQFKQFYQPQFDIHTGQLRGFEALIRWHDEELGDISPAVFIPLAEETGFIIPIGKWVLKTALKTLSTWQKKYNFHGIISVNVSPIQLMQENFISELENLIEEFQVSPNLLEIEITEGVMINDVNETINKLNYIRKLGIRISLDDFGTGYSSLNYLQKLPLNTLKIDKSFINNITSEDGVQANITHSIITMVDRMGLETIAEGVEHQEQLNLLDKFNCKVVQGFLRGKPMPFNLCDAYLGGDSEALLKN
ncbi:MAG: bifunctional diguanylate cyclase/phosphodiesterase [Treponema sp.]|nr:bifunctional diguanylate cyclase/phosphodiesterase [Treponema sp.]